MKLSNVIAIVFVSSLVLSSCGEKQAPTDKNAVGVKAANVAKSSSASVPDEVINLLTVKPVVYSSATSFGELGSTSYSEVEIEGGGFSLIVYSEQPPIKIKNNTSWKVVFPNKVSPVGVSRLKSPSTSDGLSFTILMKNKDGVQTRNIVSVSADSISQENVGGNDVLSIKGLSSGLFLLSYKDRGQFMYKVLEIVK